MATMVEDADTDFLDDLARSMGLYRRTEAVELNALMGVNRRTRMERDLSGTYADAVRGIAHALDVHDYRVLEIAESEAGAGTTAHLPGGRWFRVSGTLGFDIRFGAAARSCLELLGQAGQCKAGILRVHRRGCQRRWICRCPDRRSRLRFLGK